MSYVRLDTFDARRGLVRGRSKQVEAIWYLLKCLLFLSPLPWPNFIKVRILRMFGARVGQGVVLKPRLNIHFPWKLELGDHVWLGEEAQILNFEPVVIGSHSCISQRAFLCAGNHDFRSPSFDYRNAPITVGEGCWVGANCFVGPGVTLGNECVTTAGSVITHDLPAGMICSGNPCEAIKPRWKS
ncbi:WcaF family extracellular polysaccharide biosynthesis acetyltransferase [Prosthecobacter fusiformis]|nr:WcaF family extracellular polysaccharide biosynthesis acetyltransferase [Prosthecobacter fusiformis]